jgi:flagellar basal body-associated protein FliL
LSNGKSLGSGGFKPSGSITNIVVVVLVVVVLILCAGVFMLYNQEKGANNDATNAKQALKTLNDTYNELSGKYSALVAVTRT